MWGFGFVEDLLWGAVPLYQLLQHFADAAVPVPVVSLPSEKVPAPPSPNWTLDWGSAPVPSKTAERTAPALPPACPLQHDGGLAALGQQQGGEHPRRAKAHHHWPLGQFAAAGQFIAVGHSLLDGGSRRRESSRSTSPVDGGLHLAHKMDVLLFRASTDFFASRTWSTAHSGRRSFLAAARFTSAS